MAWVFAFVLSVGVLALAHDSEPINTNFAAPFATVSGNLQFKFQLFRQLDSYELVPIELEYGFAARQQFSLGLPLVRFDDGTSTYVRPGNLEIGYRYLIAGDNSRKFALSVNPELELPTGDKRVAESSWGAGGTLNLDSHLVKKWWTHTNVGFFTQVANIQDREKTVVFNNAIMYEAGLRLRPVLELIGESDVAVHETRIALAPEAIFAPNHHWEIKAAVPIGLTHNTPDVGLQLALTWKQGDKGRQ